MDAPTVTIGEAPQGVPQLRRDLRKDLEAYIAQLDRMPRTLDTYRKAVGYYLDWCDVTGCTGLQRADVKAFKGHLESLRSPATVHSYLTALRGFFTFLEAEHGVRNVTAGIRGRKQARGFRKDVLAPEQVRRILDAIDTGTERGLRDACLITLLVTTGLRVMEAARADIGDLVRRGGARFLNVQGKGRQEKDDKVRVPARASALLDAYLRVRGARSSAAPLFTSVSNENRGRRLSVRSVSGIVKERMRAVGIDSPLLTAHSCRHTAVTSALRAGADLREVSQMARHANLQTTLIYAHDLEREDNRAEVLADGYLFGDPVAIPAGRPSI